MNEFTALHLTAAGGHEKAVQLLLEAGADPVIQALTKLTAIHLAAAGGHQKVVHLLLAHKASIHQRDVYKKTALHFALKGSLSDIIDHFWSLAVQSDVTDICGRNFLHYAAAHGRVRETLRLLNSGFLPKIADKDGWTSMHWAARSGSTPVIDVLIQAGTDKNSISLDGWTSTTVAVYHQNDSVLASLWTNDSDHSMRQGDMSDACLEVSGHHHEGVVCDCCDLVRQFSDNTSSQGANSLYKAIYGILYRLPVSNWIAYNYCFKCFDSAKEVHAQSNFECWPFASREPYGTV